MLVHLLDSCQLYISYTKYVNFFLRSLIKEKSCHYFPGDIGRRGIMKKVTSGDIGERGGLKFGIFTVTSFLNGSLLNLFKVRASCYLTCCCISLEELFNCVCTQVSINVNESVEKIMYPIQNYVQVSMGNCFFSDKFSFFSNVLSRML